MGPRGRSELAILTLFQSLVKEPLVAQERRQAGAHLLHRTHRVRIDARRGRATPGEPREDDRRERRPRYPRAAERRIEESPQPMRVHGEIGAVATRALDHPGTIVDAGAD